MSITLSDLIADILLHLPVKSLNRCIAILSIDDYKFVRVVYDEKILHIFSLRNNSWKIVEGNFPGRKPNIIDGVSLNGAVHWDAFCLPDSLGVITVFDLAEERFKTLPFPDIPNPTTSLQGIVNVVGDYLCVHFGDYNSYSDLGSCGRNLDYEGIWCQRILD
ncbi:hypothetical protein Dsin_031112 [Dipteronia sinensis]|uniref:F-box associated beta-propeller type 1 domain-containing protein n=1 Tax=Dipteronia sinensis TaxID=43782 RepID=A0AAE0DRT4_9ROSI|nr:hypothetical protein Dsin_031112 [Dipteronia sinensis]